MAFLSGGKLPHLNPCLGADSEDILTWTIDIIAPGRTAARMHSFLSVVRFLVAKNIKVF